MITYIKNKVFRVKNKKTGNVYDCFAEMVDLNCNGHYILRFNIGTINYQGWHNWRCEYDNDKFNKDYEIIGE